MAPLLVNCAAIELISPAIHIGKWLNFSVRKVTVIQLLLLKKIRAGHRRVRLDRTRCVIPRRTCTVPDGPGARSHRPRSRGSAPGPTRRWSRRPGPYSWGTWSHKARSARNACRRCSHTHLEEKKTHNFKYNNL